MTRHVAIATLLTALLVAAPALARPTKQEQEAAKLYDAGTQHYNLGEYDAAIASYKEAYRVVPNPYFLYNIAQAYRLGGELREALTFYKSFLNALPDAPNRAEVESRITELEDAVQKQDAAHQAQPTGLLSPDGPARPRLPTPAEAAARHAQPDPASLSLAPIAASEPSHPIYKRWWFWAGVGVVAVGASTLAVMSLGDDAPSSDLGNFPVF